jgi:hypothetical protein
MDNLYGLFAVSACLLLASALMIVSHIRAWRRHQREGLEPRELDYRRRQYRRRMQTSGLIGLLAFFLPAGEMLVIRLESTWIALAYLGLTMFLVLWVCLFAMADVLATKRYFDCLRHANLLEQTRLHALLRHKEGEKKSQDTEGNGG